MVCHMTYQGKMFQNEHLPPQMCYFGTFEKNFPGFAVVKVGDFIWNKLTISFRLPNIQTAGVFWTPCFFLKFSFISVYLSFVNGNQLIFYYYIFVHFHMLKQSIFYVKHSAIFVVNTVKMQRKWNHSSILSLETAGLEIWLFQN